MNYIAANIIPTTLWSATSSLLLLQLNARYKYKHCCTARTGRQHWQQRPQAKVQQTKNAKWPLCWADCDNSSVFLWMLKRKMLSLNVVSYWDWWGWRWSVWKSVFPTLCVLLMRLWSRGCFKTGQLQTRLGCFLDQFDCSVRSFLHILVWDCDMVWDGGAIERTICMASSIDWIFVGHKLRPTPTHQAEPCSNPISHRKTFRRSNAFWWCFWFDRATTTANLPARQTKLTVYHFGFPQSHLLLPSLSIPRSLPISFAFTWVVFLRLWLVWLSKLFIELVSF